MAVGQKRPQAQTARPGCGLRRLREYVDLENRISHARHPQHRHFREGQMRRRIPLRAVVGKLRRSHVLRREPWVEPGVVAFVDKAAAIDRDDKSEPRVHARHRAHDRPAPRNARQADLLRVDLRERREQRMGADHIGHCVMEPLLLVRQIAVTEPILARRPGVFVRGPDRGTPLDPMIPPARQMALQIHRDGRVAAAVPSPHPIRLSPNAEVGRERTQRTQRKAHSS